MSRQQKRQRLRAEAKHRRDNIPPVVRSELSRRIIKRVIDWIEMNQANAVLLYLSMRSEVETDSLLKYLLAQNKTALAPITNMKRRTLTPRRITDVQRDLVLHPYGMREPNRKTCPSFPLDQIDLILVPGSLLIAKASASATVGVSMIDSFRNAHR